MRKRGKEGVSPVIATVLLIGIVVVLGLIVFLWFRGFISEVCEKNEVNIELACDDVDFEASYIGNELSISNYNIPIYDMSIKQLKSGGHETQDLSELSDEWPKTTGLKQGQVFSGTIEFDSSVTEIVLIPTIIGRGSSALCTHTCDEQYGYNILI
jgi:flagellin-like protein